MKTTLILFGLIFSILSCNTTEPPQPEKTISLTLEDASSIEAWIKLTTTNLQLPATIILKQSAAGGDQTRSTINLDKADTLLYIDSLLPKQPYTFQAIAQSSNQSITSNELSVTTMDTTSHNFTWQTWTFGEHSSSVLNDVAIIDENNIWAVGEIYLNDSLGQPDPHAYNAVHWDGNDWSINRIPFTGGCHIIYPPIKSILAFSDTDIWFASGGSLVHFDGNEYYNDCRMNSLLEGSINKIWGTSSDNLYVVGNNGTLVGYNGTLWWRMFSGTDLHLYDIYGDYSSREDAFEILVTAANRSVSIENKILKIGNTSTITALITEGIPHSIRGIWFKANRKYYVCGAGLFSKNDIETNEAWEELAVSNVYLWSIDGNDFNDIVISGAFGELLHYNGASWISYSDMPGGSLLISTKIKDDMVVTVGIENPRAFIITGKR